MRIQKTKNTFLVIRISYDIYKIDFITKSASAPVSSSMFLLMIFWEDSLPDSPFFLDLDSMRLFCFSVIGLLPPPLSVFLSMTWGSMRCSDDSKLSAPVLST